MTSLSEHHITNIFLSFAVWEILLWTQNPRLCRCGFVFDIMGCGGSRTDVLEPRYIESWTKETESTWLNSTDTDIPLSSIQSIPSENSSEVGFPSEKTANLGENGLRLYFKALFSFLKAFEINVFIFNQLNVSFHRSHSNLTCQTLQMIFPSQKDRESVGEQFIQIGLLLPW